MGRDSNIYGADETAYAGRVSSDALSPKGDEDIWGAAIDQAARSKGTGDNFNPDVKVTSNKTDSRAKTSGNHGAQS